MRIPKPRQWRPQTFGSRRSTGHMPRGSLRAHSDCTKPNCVVDRSLIFIRRCLRLGSVPRTKRPPLCLLPLGLALGHVLGSWFGDHAGAPRLQVGQSLFAALGVIGVPLGALALIRLFSSGKSQGLVRLDARSAMLTQAAAFIAIEVAEHLLSGVPLSRLFGHPGLWWVLVGQGAIAYLVVAAARLAVAAGHAFSDPTAGGAWTPAGDPARTGLIDDVVAQWHGLGSFRRRGPPSRSLLP